MSIRIEPHKRLYALIVNGEVSCYFLSFGAAVQMARTIISDEE